MDEKEKFVASTAKRKETGMVRSSSAQGKLFVELWFAVQVGHDTGPFELSVNWPAGQLWRTVS